MGPWLYTGSNLWLVLVRQRIFSPVSWQCTLITKLYGLRTAFVCQSHTLTYVPSLKILCTGNHTNVRTHQNTAHTRSALKEHVAAQMAGAWKKITYIISPPSPPPYGCTNSIKRGTHMKKKRNLQLASPVNRAQDHSNGIHLNGKEAQTPS